MNAAFVLALGGITVVIRRLDAEDGRSAVRLWILLASIRLILVGLALPGLAWAQGQGGSESSLPTLEVTWISDSHSEAGGAYIELKAKYQFWAADRFKWVEGSLVRGEGSFDGEKAAFRYRPPTEGMGVSSVSGFLNWAGQLRATDDGNAKLEFTAAPRVEGVSGPFDEALSCYGSTPEDLYTLSQDDLRALRTRPIEISPKDPHVLPGCSETSTLKIKMSTVELKYHETELDVEQLKYPGGTQVDPHVYIQVPRSDTPKGWPTQAWKEHANFVGEVLVDGENKVRIDTGAKQLDDECQMPKLVNSDYHIHRLIRSWSFGSSGPWRDDNPCPTQDWLDNPELGTNGGGTPDTWGSKRPGEPLTPYWMLDEFLVEVEGRPECGCIYVTFAMEIKPNAYRIKYSTPEVIDKQKWKEITKNTTRPNYPFSGDDGWVYLAKVAKDTWKVVAKP